MANMSYCRYENTLKDLADCLQALRKESEEGSDLSESELSARDQLLALCSTVASVSDQLVQDWQDAREDRE
jgi:hypothetical protein